MEGYRNPILLFKQQRKQRKGLKNKHKRMRQRKKTLQWKKKSKP